MEIWRISPCVKLVMGVCSSTIWLSSWEIKIDGRKIIPKIKDRKLFIRGVRLLNFPLRADKLCNHYDHKRRGIVNNILGNFSLSLYFLCSPFDSKELYFWSLSQSDGKELTRRYQKTVSLSTEFGEAFRKTKTL